MDKMQMAHEYFMKHVNTEQYKHLDDEDLISWSFDYVDAMQAEAEKRINKERPDVLNMADSPQLEWKPDWSQAPEWANSWGMAEIGQAWWLSGEWHVNNRGGFSSTGFIKAEKAPSFEYQGSWRDSLRERPNGF